MTDTTLEDGFCMQCGAKGAVESLHDYSEGKRPSRQVLERRYLLVGCGHEFKYFYSSYTCTKCGEAGLDMSSDFVVEVSYRGLMNILRRISALEKLSKNTRKKR